MGRVFFDASSVGDEWFKEVVIDLLRNSTKVMVVYTTHPRMYREMEASREKYLKLLQEFRRKGLAKNVTEEVCDGAIVRVEAHPAWRANPKVCDDAHIFGLAAVAAVEFVFTSEKRINRCRACLSGRMSRKHSAFKVIGTTSVYQRHRQKIAFA